MRYTSVLFADLAAANTIDRSKMFESLARQVRRLLSGCPCIRWRTSSLWFFFDHVLTCYRWAVRWLLVIIVIFVPAGVAVHVLHICLISAFVLHRLYYYSCMIYYSNKNKPSYIKSKSCYCWIMLHVRLTVPCYYSSRKPPVTIKPL